MTVSAPFSEAARLDTLDQYDVLDTPTELNFDRITRVVSASLDVPMAAVTLIDGHRQWLKSRYGPLGQQTCREEAFCNVAIRTHEPLIVEDAAADPRFCDNSFVNGPPYIRFYAGVPLASPGGYNLGALCAIDNKPRRIQARDIALLQDLAAMVMDAFEARKLARTDSLTGALSRRAFRDEAAKALALSLRHSHPLSCIALDLDHFKAINDRHGHAIGDRVLTETVTACRERLRNSDILGRIGGEEFAIVLPHTAEDDAMKVAAGILSELKRRVVVLPNQSISISASFGISTNARDISFDELLRRADSALYAAKDAGRSTCIAWRPAPGAQGIPSLRRVLKAGQIVFNAGRSAIDCTVRALGDAGARVDVISTLGIPDKFKLSIADDGFSRSCCIAAKQGATIEILFV